MKKEKYLQIFSYLKEFSKLRSNPVRDIDSSEAQYPEVFWLNDIPETKIFENVVRPDFSPDNDYWIRLKKPKEPTEPVFAKLSDKLEKWIEPSSLINDEAEPAIKETIVSDGKTLSIDDHPEIKEELNKYINQKWIDDLIDYNVKKEEFEKEITIYTRLNNAYKQLFRIFNKSQQFGEEYELVIGIGLLSFKRNSNNERIFRHILTQRVDINYEYSQKDSQILVSPNLESVPQIETDSILDLFEQFDSQNIIDAEKAIESYFKEKGIDTLFNENCIEDALQMFAERVSLDGRYSNTIAKPNTTDIKPTISFSPALLLRKRNTRSFTALYEKILNNIENEEDDIEIQTMNDLIGFHDDLQKDFSNSETLHSLSADDSIFFPKEYNDEQIEIILKARRNNKVLVQGPPGTGKSHTIANLICHLLAKGKKVLVTAYTKRALEVLKDKLPSEFQDLTVNLLSGDSSSIQGLQSSVNTINSELSKANLDDYQKEIYNLEIELQLLKENIAEHKNDLIAIKEKTTRKQIINSVYSGTLTEIAEIIEIDSAKHEWYKDSFCDINNEKITVDLELYIDLHKKYQQIDVSEYQYIIPSFDKLPTTGQVQEYRQINERLLKYRTSKNEYTSIECTDYNKLIEMLTGLDRLYNQADSLQIDFSSDIIHSYFKGNAFQWRQKLEMSMQILERFEKIDLKKIDKDIEITYPSGKSLKQLKNDAQTLVDFLKGGNQLSGLTFKARKPFLPKEIKEKLYYIDEIRVNGSRCDTIVEFDIAVRDLEIQQDFNEISEIWDKEIPKGNYFNKFMYFKNICTEVAKLFDIIDQSEELRTDIEKFSKLTVASFDKKIIVELIKKAEYNYLSHDLNIYEEIINNAEIYLNQFNFHPIKTKLLTALQQLDFSTYSHLLAELEELAERKKQYLNFVNFKARLGQVLPNLLISIESGTFSNSYISRFQEALFFRHAQNEIIRLMDIDCEQQILNELSEFEHKEKKIIAKLASQKAWSSVVERLQQNRFLRQHLDAWVMAVRKIGKTGKGKRAMKFRKIAQQEMEYCKDSVPCWIMPLYKVAETITPEQGMYDYIIIDEASQLGPDAIFLLYISKNIIIVGDDKQTSPEYVGVDANALQPHINRHLKGIPRSDFFGTEFSFFDHARFFCDGVTVLREHFRCMPEIIEFSNKYFYAPEGNQLYPLKQYSENRLEPLKTVFCKNGYTDGSNARIINLPEAK
ncbi:MAG: AAA domain-containing protein [Bacteroidales bacterium]|jgi:hypothetical protein|nr:AAA domain-containing protein [Bacteroidales bacterium]